MKSNMKYEMKCIVSDTLHYIAPLGRGLHFCVFFTRRYRRRRRTISFATLQSLASSLLLL
jgi:hypothetical protein